MLRCMMFSNVAGTQMLDRSLQSLKSFLPQHMWLKCKTKDTARCTRVFHSTYIYIREVEDKILAPQRHRNFWRRLKNYSKQQPEEKRMPDQSSYVNSKNTEHEALTVENCAFSNLSMEISHSFKATKWHESETHCQGVYDTLMTCIESPRTPWPSMRHCPSSSIGDHRDHWLKVCSRCWRWLHTCTGTRVYLHHCSLWRSVGYGRGQRVCIYTPVLYCILFYSILFCERDSCNTRPGRTVPAGRDAYSPAAGSRRPRSLTGKWWIPLLAEVTDYIEINHRLYQQQHQVHDQTLTQSWLTYSNSFLFYSIVMFKGSLEVKLPTYWRMKVGQCNQFEERERERESERERERERDRERERESERERERQRERERERVRREKVREERRSRGAKC